ncbi:hypothetical protein D0T25_30160 [Duganella sp. BJB488]|uniref:hypothetical protein n=1 Tax=unclassified Duganella TaxID=2636909 RepID=UPI000E350DF2|nr:MULTISPECIES: hypothetical protein [unclassified Duganella]NVD74549.1 hypothetical protein [Duganella sp. BJB1802]RFP09131.1 hypothetical protein D0T26_30320 [Duganella sp. BJB489]RFP12562.1 hypothetical protein D0T25_30160 [Duganella sp. BJB488]RFP29128.1 hypothetical protein D0T24_30845 [Duganella sp. BJB480]
MEDHYLKKTLALMSELGIRVRDTYSETDNFDDYYSNGNTYGGRRLFTIGWEDTSGYANVGAKKNYSIPGRQSVAWDAYRITIPERFRAQGRDDPIIHECVHFLQHTTAEEESKYVQFDGNNYLAYLTQRVELEAHLVQVQYIMSECHGYLESRLSKDLQKQVADRIREFVASGNLELAIIAVCTCTRHGLI